MTLVNHDSVQQPLCLERPRVPQKVAAAFNIASYVCADYDYRCRIVLAVLLLYAVDAALLNPPDQVFN
jgi:hypothetical protein